LEKIVIGTVEGDLHDIGKRLVDTLIEGNGFEVIDLGVDVKADVFMKAIEEHKPEVLGM
jgi:5-methyltetrahydrofolate--homocysteine methyltransferase